MYWPTTTARRLHLSPSGLKSTHDGSERESRIVHMDRSLNGEEWATVSADTLTVWSVRPSHVLAALVRTRKSVEEYGVNKRLRWKSDGSGIVVETDRSYLLLYSIHRLSQRKAHIYSYVPSEGPGARSRSTNEVLAPSMNTLRSTFAAGPGEGIPLGESTRFAVEIRFQLVLRIDAGLAASVCSDDFLLVATRSPAAVQTIPWPDAVERPQTRTSMLARLDWIVNEEGDGQSDASVYVDDMIYSHEMDLYLWRTSDGRVYCTHLQMDSRTSIWRGRCLHGAPASKRRRSSAVGEQLPSDPEPFSQATCTAINARFSLLGIGQEDGRVSIYTFRALDKVALLSHTLSVRSAMQSTASYLKTGQCTSLSWTSDGHALALSWEQGWSIWSTFGKLMGCSLTDNWQDASPKFADTFMRGVQNLFWGPGNTDLFLLSNSIAHQQSSFDPDKQLFVLPFAKSAVAGQHSPDNTRYASIQLDDSVLVYRGSDQPDMSIINPESDVWHQVKIPESYLAVNWPIRYACISSDGRLIAVAGRRGLTHFSSLSGRWKQFQQSSHEQKFYVEGGLQWYQHVLVAACRVPETDEHQIRLYSRDLNLDEASVLYTEHLPSAVVLTSLFDNSLLVYTADNTLHHFLIAITDMEIRLTLCGSITFEGVVGEPARVRGMSWLVPNNQQQFGDPMDDLMVATIIFLIDGKLVLLRPRRSVVDEEEVSYDMQILGDRIEFYWTHLQGVGTLENSLWGYDGRGIKLWLDALTIEQADVINDNEEEEEKPEYRTIEESLSIPLDFYPLCVLIEKGIIIGVEPEVSLRRSLEFAIFRNTTNTQLFVQHVLRSYLECKQMKEAVLFASFYHPLVYFAHALEILLHDVLEEEADGRDEKADESIIEHTVNGSTLSQLTISTKQSEHSRTLLPIIIAFLDHFDECLDVVVNCARKTEFARWGYLFSVVGEPRELFKVCLDRGKYKTAGSYLLVLHNLESIEESQEYTIQLLSLARKHGWHNLCKDLLRFTRSLDEDGRALRFVVTHAGLTDVQTTTLSERRELSSDVDSSLQTPPLVRSSSGTTLVSSVIEEEDESAVSESQRETPIKRIAMQRSASLFSSGPHDSRPPLPSLGSNGRILPASPSPATSRRSSVSNTTSKDGIRLNGSSVPPPPKPLHTLRPQLSQSDLDD